MNEISIFQIINCKTNYPDNVNSFLNTAAIFSFNFIDNTLYSLINISILSQKAWLPNNIGNHQSLNGTSIIINMMGTGLVIFLNIILIIIILIIPY